MIFSIISPISAAIFLTARILRHHPLLAALAVMSGLMTFSLMDVLMKGLAIALGTYNALIWRTMIALIIAVMLYAFKPFKWPKKPALRVHIIRGSVTAIMSFTFFWGLARTPFAEAIAISFIAPLIALYLSALLLGERIKAKAIFASILGLAGVAIIISAKLQSAFSDDEKWGVAAILFSASLYAWNLVLQRQQALIAHPIEIATFQNAIVTMILLLFAPWFLQLPDTSYAPEFIGAGLFAIVSILLMSWGYARAQAQALVPLEYSIFIWACLFGWIFLHEDVTLSTLLGASLIIIGCLIATWTRKNPKVKQQSMPNVG